MAGGARFLDPEVLARIDNLELLARTVVDGFINGLHRSPYLGLSIDFAEHRPYMPGDDIRRIDWRVYGRTDRFYVKEFEAETNANFIVALDASRSMDYGTDGITKIEYERFLAASLLYFSRQQRDRVGIIAFDDEIIDYVPPAAKHLRLTLHCLERLKPGGPGRLSGPLHKIAESTRRRGIVAVISDFYDEPEAILRSVDLLRHRGHDVLVFHVLDPQEIEFDFDESTNFEDLETGERLPVIPDRARERYRTLMAEHRSTLARRFAESRIDYAALDTSTPLDYALFSYLSRRERLSRVR